MLWLRCSNFLPTIPFCQQCRCMNIFFDLILERTSCCLFSSTVAKDSASEFKSFKELTDAKNKHARLQYDPQASHVPTHESCQPDVCTCDTVANDSRKSANISRTSTAAHSRPPSSTAGILRRKSSMWKSSRRITGRFLTVYVFRLLNLESKNDADFCA